MRSYACCVILFGIIGRLKALSLLSHVTSKTLILPFEQSISTPCPSRRGLLVAITSLGTWFAASIDSDSTAQTAFAVQRAVGSGELKCREAGNCLEIGELDGAMGWYWGGKDRCDPKDPNCEGDGQLRTTPIVGKPVPEVPNGSIITNVAEIQLDIGRDESGKLRIGLYGENCPGSAKQVMDLLSSGISTMSPNDNAIGSVSAPVTLEVGGIISNIVPGLTLSLGIPSQAYAYGRSRGLSKTNGFIAQPRPNADITSSDQIVRSHNVAGLVSVAKKGIGYGGSGFQSEDEAFENSFLITANPVPSLDAMNRVVGQVLDAESMAFLERLASLPTKKGIKGVIPGQTSGPPLLKVVVKQVHLSNVSALS